MDGWSAVGRAVAATAEFLPRYECLIGCLNPLERARTGLDSSFVILVSQSGWACYAQLDAGRLDHPHARRLLFV